jgi:hypothetical protein
MNIAIYITGVNQGKTVTGEGLCFNVFYKKGEKW